MARRMKQCDWSGCTEDADVVVQIWTDWPNMEYQQYCEPHAGDVESMSCWRATYDLLGTLLGEPRRN